MRFELIQAFSVAIGLCRIRAPGDDEVISMTRLAFRLAADHGWRWEKDLNFEEYKNKATEQEILAEGLRIALLSCKPKQEPLVPAVPDKVTAQDFAEYLWTLHCILVGDPPGTEPGRRSVGGLDAGILETFASFMSCADEDGLWKVDHEGNIGNGQDTLGGLMQGLRAHVILRLEGKR
jgi:hypothetical protein